MGGARAVSNISGAGPQYVVRAQKKGRLPSGRLPPSAQALYLRLVYSKKRRVSSRARL